MKSAITVAICAALAPVALAGPIIDFETYDDTSALENGRQLSSVNGLWGGGLMSLNTGLSSADTTNGGARVAIFDSSDPGPNDSGPDPDLLVNLGNIVIVQDNASGALTQGVSGIYDTPNDDAGGGLAVFDFSNPSHLESLDLIDINGNAMLTITLLDLNGLTRTYTVPEKWTNDVTVSPIGYDTLSLTTLAPQSGEGPGGDATAAEDAGFSPMLVTRMTVNFTGSAGLDNLAFVPGPATMPILFGLGALAARRRRA